MQTVEKEIHNEIMSTDLYISVSSDKYSKNIIEKDIEDAVNLVKGFEEKFSRFKPNNYLQKFNDSLTFESDDDLVSMILTSQEYFKKTNGIFDISILDILKNEGYVLSKNKGFIDNSQFKKSLPISKNYNVLDFKVDETLKTITKPIDLKVDFGGIGKGYIIDKVCKILFENYSNFCVSIGGDMFLAGIDVSKNYDFWAIEIENPFLNQNIEIDLPTLIVKNTAIATSGVNKRKWVNDGVEKNHIIDTRTNKSLETDLISVTVLGDNAVFSDIYAKFLLIIGLDKGIKFCDNNNISAIFVTKNAKFYLTRNVKKYVWKE